MPLKRMRRVLTPVPQQIAMHGHWKNRCNQIEHASKSVFLVLLLAVAHVQAQSLDLHGPRVPSGSMHYDGSSRARKLEFRAAASNQNHWGRSQLLTKHLPLGKTLTANADIAFRKRIRANLDTKELDMLSHQLPGPQAAVTTAVTPNRQEVEALESFKAGITGGNMSIFESWVTNDSTPCDWEGVSCSITMERVTALNLGSHQLKGSIGSALLVLGKLQFLSRLDLSNNNFGSSISEATLLNFSSLAHLNLSYNLIERGLPSQIGEITSLQVLDVRHNFLAGPILTLITNLTSLTSLLLDGNLFGGTIDLRLGMLPLQFVSLDGNEFAGSIPTALGNCSNLQEIHMRDNQLTGEIPASFGNLSRLQELIAANNLIRGGIPLDLAGCSHLTTLDLSLNQLEGPLPPELGLLSSLRLLNLSHNELTGIVANFVMNMNASSIVWLDLSYNRFNEFVPGDTLFIMENLQNVRSVNLSHNLLSGSWSAVVWNVFIQEMDVSANALSGTITSLGTLPGLQRLNISHNNFSGTISESLASLPDLISFDASYNDLEGPIPAFETVANKSSITPSSFWGNAGLCGDVLGPSHECPDDKPSRRTDCKLCARIWRPALVASVVCFLLILVVVAWVMRGGLEKKESSEDRVTDFVVNFGSKPLEFSQSDILAIIRDGELVIGNTVGSVVYKALVPGFDNVIAIKTFFHSVENNVDLRAADLWRNRLKQEATLQAGLRHRNVLKILSFCSFASFRAFLLEYMPQGSLHDHLYPGTLLSDQQLPDHERPTAVSSREIVDEGDGGWGAAERNCQLPWSVRLGIAMDIAEGLTYLHHEHPEPLVHGNLKPSNILLDENMVAKVSEFGLSKFANPFREGEATVSHLCGTVGYMPPEYALVTVISTKGDVFSYGILLLEILSGSLPTARNHSGDANYRDRNLHCFQQSPLELLDPTLRREGKADVLKGEQMMLLAKVAFLCTQENPQSRPSMTDVRSMLLQIKESKMEAPPQRPTVDELALETDEQ